MRVKSFYEIHGTFPHQGEELPADGLMVFLTEIHGVEEKEPCQCDECQFQLKYRKELFQISQLENKIKRIEKKIKDEKS